MSIAADIVKLRGQANAALTLMRLHELRPLIPCDPLLPTAVCLSRHRFNRLAKNVYRFVDLGFGGDHGGHEAEDVAE